LVRQEILRMIKNGEILAGSRLNELSLAQTLRVSRAPIREAFRALEEAGLVKLEKNRGVFVREISAEEARELYDLRATLDEMTGKCLAKHITSEQLDELFTWLDRLENAAARDVGVYFPLNIAFHDRIVEMTGNTVLLEFYRRVIDRMHLLRRRSFSAPGGNNPSRLEHRRIVEALQSRDPERAGNALRAHVENGFQRFLDISGANF
jgi:DNA-binding GntR family transcriptional regulator